MTDITEFDIFLLTYDEPNAEENWADLLSKCPWAQRIDGVKGLDEVHKAAARASTTDRFITVDGDNKVDMAFFDVKLDLTDPRFKETTLSWAGKNHTNGLVYGNGGLKLWWKENVLNMKTHEHAETEEEKVDFCWHQRYIQMNDCFSETFINGSPYQAWRAGFREGVKMSLDQGFKVDKDRYEESIWPINYKRLLVWASVGADVENGIWSVLGTRMGMYMTNLTDWDFSKISDYEWMKNFFETEVLSVYTDDELVWNEIVRLGELLRKELRVQLAELDSTQSKFFKSVNLNLQRRGVMVAEDD